MDAMIGARFHLDTNVIIGLLEGPGAARALLDAHGATTATPAVSQITRIELLSFQALTGDDEARIRTSLAAFPIVLLDAAVEEATIALRRRTKLKLPDAIVAASASVHGLKLLTLDQQLESISSG